MYEFTAGKMVSHKRIKNNLGYPGLEVVSKTKSGNSQKYQFCLLYTSDAADERSSVDLGGRRIIKKKKRVNIMQAGVSTKTK